MTKEAVMAKLTTPADKSTHKHTQANAKTFKWSNTNPTVTTGTHWRLKIGSAPFGYNYYFGPPVPFTQLEDRNVNLMLVGKSCFAVVEWSTNGGTTWTNGMNYTTFTCSP